MNHGNAEHPPGTSSGPRPSDTAKTPSFDVKVVNQQQVKRSSALFKGQDKTLMNARKQMLQTNVVGLLD